MLLATVLVLTSIGMETNGRPLIEEMSEMMRELQTGAPSDAFDTNADGTVGDYPDDHPRLDDLVRNLYGHETPEWLALVEALERTQRERDELIEQLDGCVCP